ncbi:MAG: right-handed parallel beta-helix repeat-containing protein, partial [Prosthecobacter sp.]|nr:right-handed parallel beta-helix repeat-containing protein [Prosthecobacter sp.]
AVVYVSDKGRLTLEGIQIGMGGKTEVGVFAQEAEVIIRHCAFDRAPKYACYADKASLQIRDCRFTASGGVAAAGLNGATLDVRRSLFRAGADAAIIGQDSAAVAVHECRFDQCTIAVSVRGGMARLHLNEFIGDAVAPSKKPAFVVENASSIVFAGNVVRHAVQGVVLRGRVMTPAAVTRNLIMNTELGVYAALEIEDGRASLLFARNTICQATQGGLFLDKTSHARVTNCILLPSGDGYAMAMREASDLLVDGLAACASKGSLVFDKCKPPVATLRHVCQAGEAEFDATGVAQDENTTRLRQIITMTDSGERLSKAAGGVNAVAKEFDSSKPEAFALAAAQFAAELDYARKRAAQMGAVSLNATDRHAQAGPVAFVVYPAGLGEEDAVATSDDGAPVFVSAGDYRLVAAALPEVEKPVKVPAGGKVIEHVPAPTSLWLTFQGAKNQPPARLLVPMKSPQAMREAVARVRHHQMPGGAVMPRPGVAKEEVERSLALARQHLAALSKKPPKAAGVPDGDHWHAVTRQRWVESAALRILNVAGTDADAGLIFSTLPAENFHQKTRGAALIAAIEARLGTLAGGRLSQLARGADAAWAGAAAIQLHAHGITGFDDVIVAALKDPKNDP